MTEVIGYHGPIYMTHPTKAIVPILLEELRKVLVEHRKASNYVSTQVIKNCMKKITAVDLHQRVMVDNELEIKAYHAGHVLGAAMFWIKVGSQTVVYTGDFNMNPDRHVGAACIDKCQPDLLIAESKHAIIDPNKKRCRNRDFLKNVHECLSRGGKVLIPVFICGRAQELCILLNSYWEKMNLSYPIYFASDSFTDKPNTYYKMFSSWTNDKMNNAKTKTEENIFDFKYIKTFDKSCTDKPEPMVVLATNGMLQMGLSVQIFKKWAPDENNLMIFPDICTKGTVGYKVLAGAKQVEIANKEVIKVQMKVLQMSFDAVADAKGIMKLIETCQPKNIILTHGKTEQLALLQKEIMDTFKIECFISIVGEQSLIKTPLKIPSDKVVLPPPAKMFSEICAVKLANPHKRDGMCRCWVLAIKEQRILLLPLQDAIREVYDRYKNFSFNSKIIFEDTETVKRTSEKLFAILQKKLVNWSVKLDEDSLITVESIKINVSEDNTCTKQKIISISWNDNDEDIAMYILYMLQHMS